MLTHRPCVSSYLGRRRKKETSDKKLRRRPFSESSLQTIPPPPTNSGDLLQIKSNQIKKQKHVLYRTIGSSFQKKIEQMVYGIEKPLTICSRKAVVCDLCVARTSKAASHFQILQYHGINYHKLSIRGFCASTIGRNGCSNNSYSCLTLLA